MGYDRTDRDRYENRGDRGFFDRAGDEVRSWFGDEEAERRRRGDERYDERSERGRQAGYGDFRDDRGHAGYARSNRDDRGDYSRDYPGQRYDRPEGRDGGPARPDYGYRDPGDRQRYDRADAIRDTYAGRDAGGRDDDHGHGEGYRQWRSSQIEGFDRDYEEYRRENRARFQSEFATWRQNRQVQRDALAQVREHHEVVGSDGAHVGTVDHVRADHLLLTKSDPAAGGHHHAIPSSWIGSVGDTVTLTRTAAEAKSQWREQGARGGLFNDRDRADDRRTDLDRSFSGTY